MRYAGRPAQGKGSLREVLLQVNTQERMADMDRGMHTVRGVLGRGIVQIQRALLQLRDRMQEEWGDGEMAHAVYTGARAVQGGGNEAPERAGAKDREDHRCDHCSCGAGRRSQHLQGVGSWDFPSASGREGCAHRAREEVQSLLL